MSITEHRRLAVRESADKIASIIGDNPTVEKLEQGKIRLMELCERPDLFPVEDFPLPEGDATDRTFLIYDNDEGAALYAISSIPGMTYRPHDHGGSWAIVAAIAGQEKHYFYQRAPNGDGADGTATLIDKGYIMCEQGCAVSMLPDGIHSIEGVGDVPLMHLHFYGKRFEDQAARTEYNLDTGMTERFKMEAFGFIEDRR